MRVSVKEGDKGYTEDTYGIKVFFNGQATRDVTMADEELEVISRYKRDDNGDLLYDFENDCLAEELLYGNVKIEFNP